MKEIFLSAMLSGVLFIVFLVAIVFGIIRKNRKAVIGSFIVLFFCLLTGAYSGYLFITKSYNKIAQNLKPRSGEEIYAALFGKPEFNCIHIINSQDQIIPKIDYAIWLHFTTCPEELKRITSKQVFDTKKISSQNIDNIGSGTTDWFKPKLLGDTIILYKRETGNGNGQTIYSNIAQTEAYCIDILD